MPHADLKYSDDLNIDAPAILAEIEETILSHDNGSGACKGRAYPAAHYHHTHILIEVSMLSKPHRDATFTDRLITELERRIKARLNQPCAFSLAVRYSSGGYVTNLHQPG